MKKVLFVALFAVSASAAFSQSNINKGDWMVGGDASFNSNKSGEYKTTTVGFAPNAGYFFINNFAGGLRVNVASTKETFNSTDATSSELSLAPFVRYYFLPASQKVNIFADASFGFGQNKYKSGSIDEKTNFTSYGIKAGPAIFITPATALEINLGYNSSKVKDATDRSNNFGVNFGFQIHIPGSKK